MFRRLLFAAAFTILPVLVGCTHFTHKDPHATWRMSDQVPDESKGCVFVFLIDPMDPLASATLLGERDYIQELGFGKVYYGKPCHVSYFIEKMQWLRGKCGTARFAVIGYDSGADAAQKLVEAAALSELPIDVAIFLEPQSLDEWQVESFATNSYTVRAEDLVDVRAAEGGCAESNAVRQSQVPNHPQVLSLIERELALMAMSVPAPKRPEVKRVVLSPEIPAPRSTPANPKPLAPEWQFLRPREPHEMPPPRFINQPETLPLPKAVQGLPIPKAKN